MEAQRRSLASNRHNKSSFLVTTKGRPWGRPFFFKIKGEEICFSSPFSVLFVQ